MDGMKRRTVVWLGVVLIPVGIHALINVHEHHCIAIRMRCWLMDDCSSILCCSVGNIPY